MLVLCFAARDRHGDAGCHVHRVDGFADDAVEGFQAGAVAHVGVGGEGQHAGGKVHTGLDGTPLGPSSWPTFIYSWFAAAADAVAGVAALEAVIGMLFIALLGIHGMLELPYQYAYFLLPFAFTLGVFTQLGEVAPTEDEDPKRSASPAKPLLFGGIVTVALALFGLWDYAKVSPTYELNSAVPLHDRVIQSYKSTLFLNLADYSALNLTGIAPATAEIQLRLASRVLYFRSDPQVAAAHAAAASLAGQMTLAKASAYRLWLKDKEAAEKLRLALAASGLPPALELAAFLAKPVYVPWP